MKTSFRDTLKAISWVGYAAFVFCLVLYVLLFIWVMGLNEFLLYQLAPSFLAYFLFCLAVVHTVPKVEELFCMKKTTLNYENTYVRVLLLLIWVVLINSLFFLWMYASNKGLPFFRIITNGWSLNIDNYMKMSEYIYVNDTTDRRFSIVFMPLFPLLIAGLKYIFANATFSALLINNVLAIGNAVLMYKLSALESGRDISAKAVKYLFIFPSAFFFFAPMAESLFLFMVMACFYCLFSRKYVGVAVFGFLATLTRLPGFLLLVPIILEIIGGYQKEKTDGETNKAKWLIRSLCVLSLPFAFCIYLFINWKLYGNPFQFMVYQKENWNQEMSYFWNSARYLLIYFIDKLKEGNINSAFGLFLPNLLILFGSLIIILLGAKKRRASVTAFSLVYFMFTFGPTWLLSGPRYASCMFPIALTLADYSNNNKKLDTFLTVLMLVLFFCYLHLFFIRASVF